VYDLDKGVQTGHRIMFRSHLAEVQLQTATQSVPLSPNGLKWCNSEIPYSMLMTKKPIIYLKGCGKLKNHRKRSKYALSSDLFSKRLRKKNMLGSKPRMEGQKQHDNVYPVLSKPL